MVLIRSRQPLADPATTIAVGAPRLEFTEAEVPLGEFARWVELYDAPDVPETVGRALECVLRITGGEWAGMILVHSGGCTAGATDPRAELADQLQLDYGEGPSVPLTGVQGSVLIPDTAVDQRWPRWSSRAAEFGLRSVLTVPLATTRKAVGAITVYAGAPHQFTAVDAATALLLARHAAVAVAGAQQTASLTEAVEARHLIGQAQGLLMERFAIDADQAFAVLRRYSQDGNVKLRVVAARLVTSRRLTDSSRAGTTRSPATG